MKPTTILTTRRFSALLLVLLSSALLSACNEVATEEKPIRPAQVWVVDDSHMAQTISYTGTLNARHETDLAFRIAGKITSRPIEVGDSVTVGQTLATLDSNDLQLSINNADANTRAAQANAATAQAQLAAAQSDLKQAQAGESNAIAGKSSAQATQSSAQAERDNAQTELQRSQKLFKQGFIGKSTLDTHQTRFDNATAQLKAAQAQVQTANSQIRAAQAQVEAARAQVSTAHAQIETAQAQVKAAQSQSNLSRNQAGYSALKATKAGVITDTFAETGQVVSAGQSIARIADSAEIEAHIRVGEQAVQALQIGQKVQLTPWATRDAKPFSGTIREIAPTASNGNTWLVKIALPDAPKTLKLGMTVNASLAQSSAANYQWLPPTALYQQAQQPAVWVVNDANQVALQPVTLQQHLSNGVLVTGLTKGATVIAAGVNRLHTGQTIQPITYTGHAKPASPSSLAGADN